MIERRRARGDKSEDAAVGVLDADANQGEERG
jgi:hypothetical protein